MRQNFQPSMSRKSIKNIISNLIWDTFYMCEVLLKNDLDFNTFYVLKDFNCYLRPFSAIISLGRILKPNKRNFSTKSVET